MAVGLRGGGVVLGAGVPYELPTNKQISANILMVRKRATASTNQIYKKIYCIKNVFIDYIHTRS